MAVNSIGTSMMQYLIARNSPRANSPFLDMLIHASKTIKKQIDQKTLKFRLGGIVVMIAAVFSNLIWIFLVLRAPNATRLEWMLNGK